eukprot:6175601-Pleurochrysis_carterae.AAC.3
MAELHAFSHAQAHACACLRTRTQEPRHLCVPLIHAEGITSMKRASPPEALCALPASLLFASCMDPPPFSGVKVVACVRRAGLAGSVV